MPDTTSAAFLQGQGIPIDPREIENELVRLWGPAAERVGGPELDQPTVTRVVLANLVVFARPEDAARIDEVLDTVVARYPCRAIVLRPTDEPGRAVAAEVSALCHLPAPGMPQVCSERIVLRAGPGGLGLLPASVRSLLEADLPFVLWWADDPRRARDLFLDLGDECSRLILDLPDPGADPAALRFGLGAGAIPYAGDLAWFGIAPWRELVAQFFDGPGCRDAVGRLASVRVDARAAGDDRPPRAAVWLVAWLAGQLGWEPRDRRAPRAGRLAATFASPSGEVAVEIATAVDDGLPFAQVGGVSLTTRGAEGEESYRLNRPAGSSQEVRIEVDSLKTCSLPRMVHAPTFGASHRVAVALESPRDDPPFRRALPHALWLLGTP